MESIFFPVAAVFWIYYGKNVDNTLMFLVITKKPKTFLSVSLLQLMSRCTRAGREHSQTDSQAGQWKYPIP